MNSAKHDPDNWIETIEGYQASGLSVAAYCRENDLTAHKLYYHLNP